VELELDAGIRLEVASRADVLSAHSSIERLIERLVKLQQHDARKEKRSFVSTGQTYVTIDCGSPIPGTEWDLTRLIVSGPDPETADNATAIVWIGAVKPNDGSLEPVFEHLLLPAPTTLPNDATWNRDQACLLLNEHLFVTFKGSTSGRAYRVDYQYLRKIVR
jgi:hypothetical protein